LTHADSPSPNTNDWKTPHRWTPFDVVIFDCDSTLSTVEGIDELARLKGREAEIADLTSRAMDGIIPLEAVYSERLELLQPTRQDLRQVRWLYQENPVPGAAEVIAALQAVGKEVFIVSGGLSEPVRDFGVHLGVELSHIYAVELMYDQLAGRWWEYWNAGSDGSARYLDHDGGPLTMKQGKPAVVSTIRQKHPGRALMIGDGITDLEAGAVVDLFAGFGGVVTRERVAQEAAVFIAVNDLAAVLPLALGRADIPEPWQEVYTRGLQYIRSNAVRFRESGTKQALL